MFIKKCYSNKKGVKYANYQIAHSYRQNGKVKHKTIANLGKLKESDIDSLIKGLNKIKEKPISLHEAKLKCKKVYSFGEIQVLNHIWNKLEISEIINDCVKQDKMKNIKFDITPYIKLITFNRLLNASSELKLSFWFKDIYFPEIKSLEYHKLLRSLGYITRIKNDIEKKLFEKQKDLFSLKVDLVFYDITSTYFESDGPEIAKKGYSRDKRNDRNQVLITLAITKEGFPIGHEILEGNLLDKSTVRPLIDTLKKRFEIDTCIFVGDRGMVSRENIKYLEENNYKYIFALRRRRLHEVEEILEPDLNKYNDFIEYNIDVEEKILKYLEIIQNKIRYIICHNPERAESDKENLEKKKEKVINQINDILDNKKQSKDKIIKRFCKVYNINRFYKYGLNEKEDFYYEFDEDSYAYEKLIAGKYVLKTNEHNLGSIDIIKTYKHLSKIEDSFKDMKYFLKVRPVYHQCEDNIRGHIFTTVLAYLLEKVLESYFNEEGKNRITAKRIIRYLEEVKLVENEIDSHSFGCITECDENIKMIIKKIGLKKFQSEYYLQKKNVVLPPSAIKKLSKYDICSSE
jgi:transposase